MRGGLIVLLLFSAASALTINNDFSTGFNQGTNYDGNCVSLANNSLIGNHLSVVYGGDYYKISEINWFEKSYSGNLSKPFFQLKMDSTQLSDYTGVGTSSPLTNGLIGESLIFDGFSNYLTVSAPELIVNGLSNISIELWFKPEVKSNGYIIRDLFDSVEFSDKLIYPSLARLNDDVIILAYNPVNCLIKTIKVDDDSIGNVISSVSIDSCLNPKVVSADGKILVHYLTMTEANQVSSDIKVFEVTPDGLINASPISEKPDNVNLLVYDVINTGIDEYLVSSANYLGLINTNNWLVDNSNQLMVRPYSSLASVSGNIFALASSDGSISTFNINEMSEVNRLKFSESAINYPYLIKSGDYYAVVYSTLNDEGVMSVFSISSAGVISESVISYSFSDSVSKPKIVYLGDGLFTLMSQGVQGGGVFKTVSFNGTVITGVDSFIDDPELFFDPDMLSLSDGKQLIAYFNGAKSYLNIIGVYSKGNETLINMGGVCELTINDTIVSAFIGGDKLTSYLKTFDWNHLVLVNDELNSSLYVNGKLRVTKPSEKSFIKSASDIIIGQGFSGLIDEVNLYSSTLDSGQVHYLYGKPLGLVTVDFYACEDKDCFKIIKRLSLNSGVNKLGWDYVNYFQYELMMGSLTSDYSPFVCNLTINYDKQELKVTQPEFINQTDITNQPDVIVEPVVNELIDKSDLIKSNLTDVANDLVYIKNLKSFSYDYSVIDDLIDNLTKIINDFNESADLISNELLINESLSILNNLTSITPKVVVINKTIRTKIVSDESVENAKKVNPDLVDNNDLLITHDSNVLSINDPIKSETKNVTVITKNINNPTNKVMKNVTIIEEIPKSFAESTDDIIFYNEANLVILDKDPSIMWVFDQILPGANITVSYELSKGLEVITEDLGIKSLIQREEQRVIEPIGDYSVGDGLIINAESVDSTQADSSMIIYGLLASIVLTSIVSVFLVIKVLKAKGVI